jgi:hypothetical protein
MNKKFDSFKLVQKYEEKVLARYLYRISVHSKLLSAIKATLPSALSSHALHCVSSDKKVLIYTDSATWSSQLRFYHQTMLRAIKSNGLGEFESLQIRIIPQAIQVEKINPTILPSKENIKSIMIQAENQSDEELKHALLNLGNTLNDRKKRG